MVQDVQALVGKLENEFQALNLKVVDNTAHTETAIAVNKRVEALEESISHLENMSSAAVTSMANLAHQVEQLMMGLTTLKQGMGSQFDELKVMIAQLSQSMATVGNKVSSQDNTIDELKWGLHNCQTMITEEILTKIPSLLNPQPSPKLETLWENVTKTINGLCHQILELKLNTVKA
jgi:predicted  nucleic acid-binding Zn-ribbon protein